MFLPIHFKMILNKIRKIKGIQINIGLESNPIKILFILSLLLWKKKVLWMEFRRFGGVVNADREAGQEIDDTVLFPGPIFIAH